MDENAAKTAIAEMDGQEFMGRNIRGALVFVLLYGVVCAACAGMRLDSLECVRGMAVCLTSAPPTFQAAVLSFLGSFDYAKCSYRVSICLPLCVAWKVVSTDALDVI